MSDIHYIDLSYTMYLIRLPRGWAGEVVGVVWEGERGEGVMGRVGGAGGAGGTGGGGGGGGTGGVGGSPIRLTAGHGPRPYMSAPQTPQPPGDIGGHSD